VNQQDRSFLTVFTAIMGALVLLAAAIFLVARLVSMVSSYVPDDGSRVSAVVSERIKPVGHVVLASADEATAGGEHAAAPLSGEQVVQQVCAACHQAGVLEAPVIGDQAAWEPRYAQGLDTLVEHAVNGLNAMPPKGGAGNLSDEEIRQAVVWMLTETGFELDQGATAAAAVDAELDVAKGKELYGQVCVACHLTGAAAAPILGDKAAWEPRIAQGMDTLIQHAVGGLNAMPPKGGAMHLSDSEIANIVGYIVSESQ
jgi:cytochrome c5